MSSNIPAHWSFYRQTRTSQKADRLVMRDIDIYQGKLIVYLGRGHAPA